MFQRIDSKTPKSPDPQQPAAPIPTPTANQQAEAQAPVQHPQATAPSATSKAPGGQRNILSNDVHIKGSVKFTNDLLVDGRIEGEISSDGALTVAENAHLKAEVQTKSVVIYGKVHGNITAIDRVDIKASAEMVGDVKATTISIEPGAIFVGKSEVGAPASAAPEKPAPQPQGGQTQPQGGQKKQNQPQQGNKSEQKGSAKAS